MIHVEEFQEEDLEDPAICHMLASFRYVRCAYTHFEVPSHHALHALRTLVVFYGLCLVKLLGPIYLPFKCSKFLRTGTRHIGQADTFGLGLLWSFQGCGVHRETAFETWSF